MDFEEHMEDIQNKVKTLSAERDQFKTLFIQVSFRNKYEFSYAPEITYFTLVKTKCSCSFRHKRT